jgi:sirohydrochlorin ferrochelatase
MDDKERYMEAAHAMQSVVAAVMGMGDLEETTPKHLRVGVNSALCSHAALVRLLTAKGLFTEEEYVKEVADEMEREKERYEKRISPDGRVKLH